MANRMPIGLRRATELHKHWSEMSANSFEVLTFRELEVGDKFITLPSPGDNNGHGGFKRIHRIFCKLNNKRNSGNAVALSSGGRCKITFELYVVQVR